MSDLHIMVVEDDTDTFEFMTMFLDGHGYRTVLYSMTGGISDEKFQEQTNLLILDLHVYAYLTGWYLFQALRASPATAHIPVLLYSSDGKFLYTHRQEILSQHGDVLEKPFHADALLTKIEALTNTVT